MVILKKVNRNPWHVFWILACANLLVSFDMFFLNVALPTIANDFNLPLSRAAWIALSGILTIGAFLLPAGSISDKFGRKRMQLIAIGLMFIGSIVAAIATTPLILIIGRILSSSAIAIIHTQNMSIIGAVFPDTERGKAIGSTVAVSSIGFLISPLAGGYLINFVAWQSAYWLIAFLTIPVFIISILILQESQVSYQRIKKKLNFDWIGAVLIAFGISLAVIALNEGNDQGWLSLIILGMIGGSFLCLVAFVLWELNIQDPLFEFRYFASKLFSYSLIVRFFAFFGYATGYFVLPFYIQDIKGYGADIVGIVIFTAPVGLGVGSFISGRFEDKRIPMIFLGLMLATLANILFVLALSINLNPFIFAGVNLIAGLGFGIWLAPLWALSLASTDQSSYSLGAAIQNLVRNTSMLFATATSTAIISSIMIARGFVGDLSDISNDSSGNSARAFILGAQIVFSISAIFGIGTMLATILVRNTEKS